MFVVNFDALAQASDVLIGSQWHNEGTVYTVT